jgi:hypothetical protein
MGAAALQLVTCTNKLKENSQINQLFNLLNNKFLPRKFLPPPPSSIMAPLSALMTSCMLLISAASAAAKTEPIDLGECKRYAIVAYSTIVSSGVDGTVVTGDMGLHPGSAVVGFPPAVHNGVMEAANAAALAAKASLSIAYDEASSLAFNRTLSNIDMGGLTLPEGVYKFDASAALTGALTLDAKGDPNATWVFQIGSDLRFNDNSYMQFVSDFGNADFIYWQVGTSAILEVGANVMGNIMAFQSVTMKTSAVLLGRALASNAAVNLDFSTVTKTSSNVASNNGLDDEAAPTIAPTAAPSKNPTARPSAAPSRAPTAAPTVKGATNPPSAAPTSVPTARPTIVGETNPPTTTPTVYVAPSSDNDDDELSGGAIAGIVIGSVIVAGAIIGTVAYFVVGGGSAAAGSTAVPPAEPATEMAKSQA